ncbi:hypothetical protein SAMN05444166_4502 [Singulisphaera sp. GP187]|uniref:DUF4175 family protein n=1 Tax=Singulisphaera sp. GP187 TaxID=1882752 RepID=UPI00092C6ABD|nr:DUF4175 family protein [Singulisphaera sp. GP187]SIO41371.1 hypothetical protein SAMN05444166_4502 [Singulisphaera sp. GP187]
MSTELRQALEQVARRFRQVRLWSSLALCWLAWAIVGLVIAVLLTRANLAESTSSSATWVPAILAALALATGAVCAITAHRWARDLRWVARQIEAKHPELATGLLAAVEQAVATPAERFGFLQATVIRKALDHRRASNWDDIVPTWRLQASHLAHAVALAFLIVAVVGLLVETRSHASGRNPGGARPVATGVVVDPGNTELERGASLLVVARFHDAVPAEASLVIGPESNAGASRVMTRSLEDPTFAARVESVDTDLSYHVEFVGRSTPTYRVRVFEYPELQRTDATLVFPHYTSLDTKTVEDVRHVTAVEGTELTLLCHLNKDVSVARLVDEQGQALTLNRQAEGGDHLYRARFTLTQPKRFKVQLVDRDGRANKLTSEIVINVTRNRPPVVAMTQPSRDVRVSPVEELTLKAKLDDDFGVVRHGLTYSVAGQDPQEVVLPAPASKSQSKNLKAEHLLNFESFHAIPDQLVTYFFWAEDVGPDNQPRRASGDMFFAEVRHFEEIFRQGEAPPSSSSENQEQQQGQNAQQAEKLAELQKEIINGTWKVIRRETGAKRSAEFAADSKLLLESQQSAIAQATELAEKLRDPKSKANLEQATRFMKDAETQLSEAVKSTSIAAHTPALAAEQAAYQALLKLRAREFEVTRSRSRQRSQQGGQASAGSPSQQQLQQLELSNDENRYEEQSAARVQSQKQQEQRETRQVISRLRELAQRQTDLNDRLKELQSALEEAKTAEAKQEIERQLKRLRDQEQQILRDTDELRERMEREENKERMAEARQQIEQSREHVRQASEALEQGRVPQALTEGARAGRQLNDLREELRKGAADRFTEEMTEMRHQARQLNDDQDKLSERLEAKDNRPARSLRDNGEGEQTKQGLEQQKKRLDQLLDRMQTTVQEAEESEPLLAKGLYDTVRKANEQKIPDALKVAEQLADAGIAEEAAKASRHAGRGINQLREGVERAAESVLGDETAALKRAQGEVEDLADQINREIARATGEEPNGRPGQANPRNRQGRQGEQDPEQGQQPGQQGQQPGQQGQQPGQQGQQPGQQGQRGGQRGQQGQGPLRGGNTPQGDQPGQPGRQAGALGGGGEGSGLEQMLEGLSSNGGTPGGPITGEGFRRWSDRMRDVEELLNDPELRAEAARIRDRVRGAREEFKRHSKEPDWTKLKDLVAEPIGELSKRIAEEVRKRESPDSLVPIDRDSVPPEFAEGVRRYYEQLGSGRKGMTGR